MYPENIVICIRNFCNKIFITAMNRYYSNYDKDKLIHASFFKPFTKNLLSNHFSISRKYDKYIYIEILINMSSIIFLIHGQFIIKLEYELIFT